MLERNTDSPPTAIRFDDEKRRGAVGRRIGDLVVDEVDEVEEVDRSDRIQGRTSWQGAVVRGIPRSEGVQVVGVPDHVVFGGNALPSVL
jgi:hypothetical protein